VFESLFLAGAGVAETMGRLDPTEIALLHLLKIHAKPVDVAFFSRLDPPKNDRWSHSTFSQRFQGAFSKVKDRLVRGGILLLVLEPEAVTKTTKMERWRFALPEQFCRHLPPLVESAKGLSGEGKWSGDLAREKLKSAVGEGSDREKKDDRVEIADGELRWGGQSFRANRVMEWQKLQWQTESASKKRRGDEPYTFLPADAVLRILAELEAGQWADANGLAAPLEVFCRSRVDVEALCESGWRWGLLAKQEADGRNWYRPAPPSATVDVAPDQYLAVKGEVGVAVDLDAVPLEALDILVQLSDQKAIPGGKPRLLLTPNLVKLGRTADTVAALPLGDWLQKNAPAFHHAFASAAQRQGKTILHENLSIARVRDLSLKVALVKALGNRIVPLGEEFVAFPSEAVAEVKRLVAQMGHVVKEVAHREP